MDTNGAVEFSLEQQFHLRSVEAEVKNMDREQAQKYLMEVYRLMMVKDTMYKRFIKQEFGFNSPPTL